MQMRHDLFQYMVENADWSVVYQHNSNALYANSKYTLLIILIYPDLLMQTTRRVNTAALGTTNVRERVNHGFCRPETIMQEVRKEFLQLEPTFIKIIDETYFGV